MVWFKYIRFLVFESRPYTRTSQVEPTSDDLADFSCHRHLRQCGENKWHMVSVGLCETRSPAITLHPSAAKPPQTSDGIWRPRRARPPRTPLAAWVPKRVMVRFGRRDKSSAAQECFLTAETPAPGPPGYSRLLGELKQRIQAAQLHASLAVNRELVSLYW
jgi:hypothetical protein